ncbi:MAG: PQQ-binding-like beta-propeller repeat protein [Spirochaetota bacterium]
MEQQLRELASRTGARLDRIEPTAPLVVAGRVYAQRKRTLIRSASVAPAILGSLILAGTMGISLSAPAGINKDTIIEQVSPGNAETVWKREVTPTVGPAFHLTLDLRNRLAAHEVQSQRVLWQQVLPPVAASSAPVVFGERQNLYVTVATSIGAVYLVAAKTGQILWMQNLSDRVEVSPLPVQDLIITVACADGRIYGLNRADGHIEYMIQTGSRIAALEPVADGVGEHVYAVADGRRVVALNARTGDLQWRRDTYGTVSDSPLVAAGTIITPTTEGGDSKLWAFDQAGEIKWINTFDRYTNLTAAEDYIAMSQGSLVTLIRATTGEPVHYWQLAESPADISLAREGNRMVVRTDQGMLVSALN